MVSATHIKNLCEALLTFEFKRLCLFGAIFGECGECGYYRDFGEKPHYPLCPHSPLYKPPREAHLTFEFSVFTFQFVKTADSTERNYMFISLSIDYYNDFSYLCRVLWHLPRNIGDKT